jgi:hypothetical protein
MVSLRFGLLVLSLTGSSHYVNDSVIVALKRHAASLKRGFTDGDGCHWFEVKN